MTLRALRVALGPRSQEWGRPILGRDGQGRPVLGILEEGASWASPLGNQSVLVVTEEVPGAGTYIDPAPGRRRWELLAYEGGATPTVISEHETRLAALAEQAALGEHGEDMFVQEGEPTIYEMVRIPVRQKPPPIVVERVNTRSVD